MSWAITWQMADNMTNNKKMLCWELVVSSCILIIGSLSEIMIDLQLVLLWFSCSSVMKYFLDWSWIPYFSFKSIILKVVSFDKTCSNMYLLQTLEFSILSFAKFCFIFWHFCWTQKFSDVFCDALKFHLNSAKSLTFHKIRKKQWKFCK